MTLKDFLKGAKTSDLFRVYIDPECCTANAYHASDLIANLSEDTLNKTVVEIKADEFGPSGTRVVRV